MNRGSGILLIAASLAFLWLYDTGRWDAVKNAIVTGDAGGIVQAPGGGNNLPDFLNGSPGGDPGASPGSGGTLGDLVNLGQTVATIFGP